jgi:hypothetical protein
MACVKCTEQPETARLEVGNTEISITGCAGHLYQLAETYVTGRRVQETVRGWPADPHFRCPRCRRCSESPWNAIFGYCPHCATYTA